MARRARSGSEGSRVRAGGGCFLAGVARTGAIVAAFVALGLAGGSVLAERGGERGPRGIRGAPAPYLPGMVPGTEPSEPAADPLAPAPALWLVDGYNALHVALLRGPAREGAWWSVAGREALLARVRRFEGGAGRVAVVFDGPDARELPDPGAAGPDGDRLRLVFAPSADAWLLGRAGEAAPGEVAVVTADRRLAARARARGATVVSPQDFLARCPEEPAGSI